ncbi:MAG TPA: S-layer homology domain-containing protein [Egicoccus sp.]|nr:S-layer homology domain-containing protein [Egicoccus sp.]HSK23547.1 S-layer homology domain-containing protein [Egicoccus sp.]
MSRRSRSLLAGLTLLAVGLVAPAAHAQAVGGDDPTPAPSEPAEPADPVEPEPEPGPPYDAVVTPFVFPVDGAVTVAKSFGDPRGGGTRDHKGVDMGGTNAYGLPVHAAVAGEVRWITGLPDNTPAASAGYAIGIRGVDGRTYRYMHLGRQDGLASEAYAAGIGQGAWVTAGQLIGFLGHSGNASPSWPHLHFEIIDDRVTNPRDEPYMDPYPTLIAARERGDLPAAARRFLDVPATFSHHDAIVWLADNDITTGCGSRNFCPNLAVNRGQLATFLAKALDLPEPQRLDYFSDVAASHSHARGIAQLAERDISRGAPDGTYGPNRPVTREQMASLLSAARGLQTAGVAEVHFSDVRPDSVHAGAIAALYQAGIAQGSSDGAFHPAKPVTRAEMATFLKRSFG